MDDRNKHVMIYNRKTRNTQLMQLNKQQDKRDKNEMKMYSEKSAGNRTGFITDMQAST